MYALAERWRCEITHIGGPTVLIEFGGWRLLTDPTFDPAGGTTPSAGAPARRKRPPRRSPPTRSARSTRSCSATTTTTTTSTPPAGRCCRRRDGAHDRARRRRLGGNAHGLAPWAKTELEAEGKPPIEVTATPCRHGPPLSQPIVGDVVGFALTLGGPGARRPLDLRRHRPLRRRPRGRRPARRRHRAAAPRRRPLPDLRPLRYTMTAAEAVELCGLIGPTPRSRSTTRAGTTSARAARRSRRSSRRRRRSCAKASAGCRSAPPPRSASR